MQRLSQIAGSILAFTIAMGSLPAQAQVFKCVKNGVTSYQSEPCEKGSSSASELRVGPGGLPWEGIRADMSAQEIGRVVSAVPAEGGRAANGAVLTLRKTGVKMAGLSFTATYYFLNNGRLDSVHVERVAENERAVLDSASNKVNLADYKRLATLFRNKYGTEAGSTLESPDTGFPGLSASTDWSLPEGGKVSLSIVPLTATTSTLKCMFQQENGWQ